MKQLFLFFIGIFTATLAFAQEAPAYEASEEGFEYIEIIKGDADGRLPLLIAFHYSGGTPLETIRDYDSLKKAVRIIVPKGNFAKRNGFSYYPDNYYQQDSLSQSRLAKATVDSIAQFVKAIEKKYHSLAIVSGISQGGDISFALAQAYPALCKAAFPFAAVIKDLPDRVLVLRPVYLFQGDNDPIVSVETTRARVQSIGGKMNIRLFTYPGVAHEISAEMKKDYSKLIDEYLR